MNGRKYYENIEWFQPMIKFCEERGQFFYFPWSSPSGNKLLVSHTKHKYPTLEHWHEVSASAWQITDEKIADLALCRTVQVTEIEANGKKMSDALQRIPLVDFMLEEAALQLKRAIIFGEKEKEKTISVNCSNSLFLGREDNFKDKSAEYEIRAVEREILEAMYLLHNRGNHYPTGERVYRDTWCSLETLTSASKSLHDTYITLKNARRINEILGARFRLTAQGLELCRDREHLDRKFPKALALADDIFQVRPDVNISISELLEKEEGEDLEFKESFLYDRNSGGQNEKIKEKTRNTVAAFMNRRGGILLIGVNNQGQAIGLDKDYKCMQKVQNDSKKDFYMQTITHYLLDTLGNKFGSRFSPEIVEHEGKDICKITVRQSKEPVWIKKRIFPVRFGNTTRLLEGEEAADYIKQHFR